VAILYGAFGLHHFNFAQREALFLEGPGETGHAAIADLGMPILLVDDAIALELYDVDVAMAHVQDVSHQAQGCCSSSILC
jgi:hypothetical protein